MAGFSPSTYAILYSKIKSLTTGISNIKANGNQIIFTLQDGTTQTITIPNQLSTQEKNDLVQAIPLLNKLVENKDGHLIYDNKVLLNEDDLSKNNINSLKDLLKGLFFDSDGKVTINGIKITQNNQEYFIDNEQLVLLKQMEDYLNKDTYDVNKNGIVDKAETLEGLTKTIDELNKSLTNTSIVAGNNIEIIDNKDGTLTINSSTTGTGNGLTPEQELKLNNSASKTELNSHIDNKANPHETNIENLADTSITSLLDKQALVYDATTGTWKNDSIVVTESGKIKLNASTSLDYLENYIDNNTIQIENNLLVVKTIDGLTLSVTEINGLKDKINTISSAGMNYTGTVATKADLDAISSASSGETKIVLADESQSGKRMTYVFNGSVWESLGEFSVQIRDFTVNPLDLTSEVTGKLPQAHMDLTGLVKNTDLADYMDKATYDTNNNGIVDKAETLEGLTKTVEELNNSLSKNNIIAGNNIKIVENNGNLTISSLGTGTSGDVDLSEYMDKTTYASETNAGAVKYADNLSATMQTSPLQYYGTDNDNKLGMHYFPINIDKTNTGIEQKIALDAKANTDIAINSALDISDNKIIVDTYKFVDGTQDIHTTKVFNNTESHNFFYDKDNVEFTDSMHVKKEHEYAITLNADSVYESEIINKNDFIEILGLEMK